ncbi:MerC family mercury resistance protein [Microbulbifer sp. SH-1]|uniref:MerC domain-containing protein n=1 Tax=Microbulbifer sp. SH-1 TaxID=2681547 RepID=UPI00140BD280|nr:MerC domain-containing protein [Microbulbifer sp. SH-1]QIL90301.1 MerC family mercury resistance protein [Microbulbifer sp. SH-1]
MKDTAGIFVTGLCLLHCLTAPLLVVLGGAGVLSAVVQDEMLHLVLLALAVLIALASFPAACRQHRRPAVMIAGFSGVSILMLAVALGLEGHWELVVSTIGASLLVAAHWANRRLLCSD